MPLLADRPIRRRRRRVRWACAAMVGALILAACARPSTALHAENAWVRWLPGGLPAAGYLTLVNPSARDRFLISATSPDYGSVALHQSYRLANGAEGMRAVPRLRVPAHGRVALAPGGYHLMLMDPRRSLAPGDTVGLILRFAGGQAVPVRLPVRPPSAAE